MEMHFFFFSSPRESSLWKRYLLNLCSWAHLLPFSGPLARYLLIVCATDGSVLIKWNALLVCHKYLLLVHAYRSEDSEERQDLLNWVSAVNLILSVLIWSLHTLGDAYKSSRLSLVYISTADTSVFCMLIWISMHAGVCFPSIQFVEEEFANDAETKASDWSFVHSLKIPSPFLLLHFPTCIMAFDGDKIAVTSSYSSFAEALITHMP